jgi:hypothetical protein
MHVSGWRLDRYPVVVSPASFLERRAGQHRVEGRQVDSPERPGILRDPDFTNPQDLPFSRLPIVGIGADLDLVKLVTRFRSGIVRKVAKTIEAVTKKEIGFTLSLDQNRYISARNMLSRRAGIDASGKATMR